MDSYKNNVVKLVNALKGVTWKTTLYPAAVSIFAITIVILFIMSARFISKNINRVFVSEEDAVSGLTRLDTVNYLPVAEKLGIPTGSPEKPPIETPVQTTINTETTSGNTDTTISVNKASLKIAVYNGTNTAGLASNLKKLLESGGFVVAETGNKKKESEFTIIRIKKSKESVLPELQSTIKEHYALSDPVTLDENNTFDVVIVIGGK